MTRCQPHARPAANSNPVPIHPPGLAGRKVRLREVCPADRSRLIGFDRDSARSHPGQLGGYRHWAVHRAGVAASGDDVQFAIDALHGGMLVGSISTVHADRASGRFSYGVGIGMQHRRCGYASDAISILLAFMFEQCGYRRCDVSIYGGNLASLTMHGGLGFREVDRLRDTELLQGGIKFLVLMSITAHEFAAVRPISTGSRPPVRPGRGRHWRARRGRHWPAERPR